MYVYCTMCIIMYNIYIWIYVYRNTEFIYEWQKRLRKIQKRNRKNKQTVGKREGKGKKGKKDTLKKLWWWERKSSALKGEKDRYIIYQIDSHGV